MIQKILAAFILLSLEINAQSCKEPIVDKRLLANDVRYASPFYVIALPRTSVTEQMDNVCYSYFENGDNFFHIMSITFKNGTNVFYTYTKGDLLNRAGLAIGSGILDSHCVFHDYTLTPICQSTVFVLYRCFIEGDCNKNIDIGVIPGVDIRIVLAATPNVSESCQVETRTTLQNTSILDGNDYVILPQQLVPQCITHYNNTDSIGKDRAVGSKQVTNNDLEQRFGFSEDQEAMEKKKETNRGQTIKLTLPPVKSTSQGVKSVSWPAYNIPPTSKNTYNRHASTVNPVGTRPGLLKFVCL